MLCQLAEVGTVGEDILRDERVTTGDVQEFDAQEIEGWQQRSQLPEPEPAIKLGAVGAAADVQHRLTICEIDTAECPQRLKGPRLIGAESSSSRKGLWIEPEFGRALLAEAPESSRVLVPT